MKPDFYRDPDEGQLYPEERMLLYGMIRKRNPRIVYEIGTWLGGGSTYIISSALRENENKGMLYTVEQDGTSWTHAHHLYSGTLAYLHDYVTLIYGRSTEELPRLLEQNRPDFIFLDGANDARQTEEEYEMFRPFLSKETVVACHDWYGDKTANVESKLNGPEYTLYGCISSLWAFVKL